MHTERSMRGTDSVIGYTLPIMGSRRKHYKTLLHKLCMEEGIGFVDMWVSFVKSE